MAIVLSSHPIYAALFGAGYTNLTTPRIESFRPAMMQVGLSSHWGKSDALNFDMNFNDSITSQFSMGATLSIALMSTTPINPYSPVMGVGSSTGIYLRKECSIFQELHNEFESVKESINDYKQVKAQFEQQIAQFKSDLETLQSTKEGISTALNKLVKTYQPFEGNSQSTEEVYVNGAASFDFFQRAQSFYNQGAYYNAIQELKNASPFLPIFPIQIGLIYYLLGDLTNAIRYGKEGYMLNPQHPELQKLPKVILEDIRARSRAKKGE